MGVLGKVTSDLDAPRGPDVSMRIVVQPSWLGREVRVKVPRTLHCALCEGGGCDQCDRAGAISLRGRTDDPATIDLRLPSQIEADKKLCLRIPEEGGVASDPTRCRGHLLLTILVGPEASLEVELIGPPQGLSAAERRFLMKRSGLVAAGLILLFLGLLRLSGWM